MSMISDFTSGLRAFEAPLNARLAFLRRTYLHLAGAVLAFVAISAGMMAGGVSESIAQWVFAEGAGMRWMMVLGGGMVVGWLATGMATSSRSTGAQYGGLALYALGQAFIFAPFLWIAQAYYTGVLLPAAMITLIVFGGLTFYVLASKKDFSFLGGALRVGMFAAIGLILVSVMFGFNLGVLFTAGMILLACGAILYDTSKVLHHYRTDQHVAASLHLFASVMLLFWYVLQLLMYLQGRD